MSIIFILAALGLTFGYTYPKYDGTTSNSDLTGKSVAELKALQVEYQAALQKAAEIEDVRNGLLAKYNSISNDDRARISKLMPDNIDSVRLIIDINNVASSYGMSLRNISLSQPSNDQSQSNTQAVIQTTTLYTYMTLDFSTTGTYNNLVAFLGGLQKSLRVADIANLSIGPVSSSSSSSSSSSAPSSGGSKTTASATPQYTMKISVKIYYLNS